MRDGGIRNHSPHSSVTRLLPDPIKIFNNTYKQKGIPLTKDMKEQKKVHMKWVVVRPKMLTHNNSTPNTKLATTAPTCHPARLQFKPGISTDGTAAPVNSTTSVCRTGTILVFVVGIRKPGDMLMTGAAGTSGTGASEEAGGVNTSGVSVTGSAKVVELSSTAGGEEGIGNWTGILRRDVSVVEVVVLVVDACVEISVVVVVVEVEDEDSCSMLEMGGSLTT